MLYFFELKQTPPATQDPKPAIVDPARASEQLGIDERPT
mgnify:CR=1 FL=1